MARGWHDLDPRLQQGLLLAAGVDAGLRIAALIDLAQRPDDGVVGGRGRWVAALVVVSSLGVLPVLYFLRGRR